MCGKRVLSRPLGSLAMLRVIRPLMLVLTALLIAGCETDPSAGPESPSVNASSSPAVVRLDDVISATDAGGDAKVALSVEARMPEAFDDGVPRRRFAGEGFLDRSQNLAGITYRLSGVPNAAGYFGQADGKTSVYYTEDAFVLSFAVMAKALDGPADWFRYELDDFSVPSIRKLGIGQLREIGLADPRLALALLEGGPDELPVASAATEDGSAEYRFSSDTVSAAGAPGHGLDILFAALAELGVTSVDLTLSLDEEQRVHRLGYAMSYRPEPGAGMVDLHVQIEFLKYGLEGQLGLPPTRAIAHYEEYLTR